MGAVLLVSLLITVVGCASIRAEESVENFDRIITVCSEDAMEIHLRKDFDEFSLKGEEPECTPVYTNFTEYDGTIFRVKTWKLPLTKGDGLCGLRYVPVPDSDLMKHETTIYGQDKDRAAYCIRTGVLDKRGAAIRLESLTPELVPLKPEDGKSTVEVKRRSTISAYFHHRFPQAASVSLHPIQCWVINEKRQTRKLVIDNGCPVKNTAGDATYVVLGSESASMVTGDLPHVFFNAEPALFEDENPADLPTFRLQCTVMPCKGSDLFQQVIGVGRCPSIAGCQTGKMVHKPTDVFEVNQDFSLTISDESIPARSYRPLRGPIYPGEYWFVDSKARAVLRKEETVTASELPKAIYCGLVGALLAAILIAGCLLITRSRGKTITTYVRQRMTSLNINDCINPEKHSTSPLVEEDYYGILVRQLDVQPADDR